jgi:dTDP-4-dehydrorhamnose 3,5-epimerase-like enzyme
LKLVTYNFALRGDERGSLVAIEEERDIPFTIRRVYYIFGTQPGVRRGLHAHKTLRQVLVCVHGSCSILLDDGTTRAEVEMNDQTKGLLVDTMVWHEMYNFSPECVLLVLAGDFYAESDYIRDYDQFLELAGN